MLSVSDFTYVAIWAGFVYATFVIDNYAQRIVSWRVTWTTHPSFVLDKLDRALHDRQTAHHVPNAQQSQVAIRVD